MIVLFIGKLALDCVSEWVRIINMLPVDLNKDVIKSGGTIELSVDGIHTRELFILWTLVILNLRIFIAVI